MTNNNLASKLAAIGTAAVIALSGCGSSQPKRYNTYPDPTRHEQVVAMCRELYATGNKKYFDCLQQHDTAEYRGNDVLREHSSQKARRRDD